MVRKNLNKIRDSGINLFIGINLNFFFFFQMYQRVIYIYFWNCLPFSTASYYLFFSFKQMKIEDSMDYFTMHQIDSFCYIINVAYVYGYAFGTCLIDFSFFSRIGDAAKEEEDDISPYRDRETRIQASESDVALSA